MHIKTIIMESFRWFSVFLDVKQCIPQLIQFFACTFCSIHNIVIKSTPDVPIRSFDRLQK